MLLWNHLLNTENFVHILRLLHYTDDHQREKNIASLLYRLKRLHFTLNQQDRDASRVCILYYNITHLDCAALRSSSLFPAAQLTTHVHVGDRRMLPRTRLDARIRVIPPLPHAHLGVTLVLHIMLGDSGCFGGHVTRRAHVVLNVAAPRCQGAWPRVFCATPERGKQYTVGGAVSLRK